MRNSLGSTSRKVQYLIIVLVLLFIGLQLVHVIDIPTSNLISNSLGIKGGGSYTFDWKWSQLFAGTSSLVMVSFLLGLFVLMLSRERQSLTVLTCTCLLLFIYFLPEGFSLRALDILAPFITLVIVFLISKLFLFVHSEKVEQNNDIV